MGKIMITGAAGFIGSKLYELFLKRGWHVLGIDRNFSNENKNKVQIDLLNDNLEKLLKSFCPDTIIHCAGSADVGFSIENPLEDFRKNTEATYRLLCGVKDYCQSEVRIIFLSSASVYGQPTQLPILEECMLNPISPYALHKKIGEDICCYFINNYGFDIKILRIFSAYGPGIKKQIFWDMRKKILSTGELILFGSGGESRDYIYIDDLVDAIYKISMSKTKEYIINIGSGIETTICDAAVKFLQYSHLGRELLHFNNIEKEGDPLNWRADISKLQSLGFTCRHTFGEGLKKYIEWLEENGL